MIHAAILVSREAGLGGAFGLHSLPDSGTLRFYVDTMGMALVGIEQTHEGPLLYLEASAPRAAEILDREAA
jgi:hypothetical protein